MTYIELINEFWRRNLSLVHPLSSAEAEFYFYLLKECNLQEWKNPFRLPTRKIVMEIDFRKDTITYVRNSLQQKGFIKFTKGDRRAEDPEYTLLDSYGNLVQNTYQTTYQNPYQNPYQNSYQTPYQNMDQNAPPIPPNIKTKDLDKEISSDEDTKKVGRSIEERKQEFFDSVSPYIPKYGQRMIDNFCEYWTRMKTDTLMRFETEDKFSLGGRLATWQRNDMDTDAKVTNVTEKERLYGIDWSKVRNWYNGLGLTLSRWTEGRKKAYISIIDSYNGDMGKFREAIIRFGKEVKQSDWILGLSGSPMRDFEWFFTEDNFVKVIDGKYRNNNYLQNGRNRQETGAGHNAPDPNSGYTYDDEENESWRHSG